MVAYTKPQQRKIEESERLRGERDQQRHLIMIVKQNYTTNKSGRFSSVFRPYIGRQYVA